MHLGEQLRDHNADEWADRGEQLEELVTLRRFLVYILTMWGALTLLWRAARMRRSQRHKSAVQSGPKLPGHRAEP